ncbi:MAG TPA: hypothetical protein VF698_20415, partial [Thermoanaerobaculia bacterium]
MWTFQTPGSRRRFAGAFVLVAAAALSAAAIRWSTDPRRALLSAANELQFRRGDARLAEALDYKPRGAIRADGAALQTIRSVAGRLQHEWRTRGSLDAGRAAAPALLLAGD